MRRINYFIFLLYSLALLTACQNTTGAPNNPVNSTPMLTVREATNCRTGPGETYELVFTYLAGTQLEIAGRYDPGDFWLVKSTESPTGVCWMWGEYVDVTGNSATVSNVTPPPVPTGGPLEVLIVDQWEYSCNSDTLTFVLNWRDRATGETGYRIFRNGALLVELSTGSTTYTDTFNVSAGERVEYYLQAFGPDWTMNSSAMTMSC
jgi:uncharacterized protein YraI